jgi:hypothetical protein
MAEAIDTAHTGQMVKMVDSRFNKLKSNVMLDVGNIMETLGDSILS